MNPVFLLDENLPRRLVRAMMDLGLEIVWVRWQCPGLSDEGVRDLLLDLGGILVTQDKGFGIRAERGEIPARCGVILLRVKLGRDPAMIDDLARRVATGNGWRGKLTVLERDGLRTRPLPAEGK